LRRRNRSENLQRKGAKNAKDAEETKNGGVDEKKRELGWGRRSGMVINFLASVFFAFFALKALG
jgi:hypothetical protein